MDYTSAFPCNIRLKPILYGPLCLPGLLSFLVLFHPLSFSATLGVLSQWITCTWILWLYFWKILGKTLTFKADIIATTRKLTLSRKTGMQTNSFNFNMLSAIIVVFSKSSKMRREKIPTSSERTQTGMAASWK